MKKRIVMEQSHRIKDVETEMAEIFIQVIVLIENSGMVGSSLNIERLVRFAMSKSL